MNGPIPNLWSISRHFPERLPNMYRFSSQQISQLTSFLNWSKYRQSRSSLFSSSQISISVEKSQYFSASDAARSYSWLFTETDKQRQIDTILCLKQDPDIFICNQSHRWSVLIISDRTVTWKLSNHDSIAERSNLYNKHKQKDLCDTHAKCPTKLSWRWLPCRNKQGFFSVKPAEKISQQHY